MKNEIKPSQHTPTPWRIAPDEPLIVETMDGSEIADCSMLNASMPKAADAAFIVRSTNNFENMLSALKYVVESGESYERVQEIAQQAIDEAQR